MSAFGVASADALREAFDRTFAVAPRALEDPRESVLLVQVGGDPYSIRLAQVAALFVGKRVMWVPSPVRELRGVVSVRGAILPVYDLAELLGYPKTTVSRRWLVTVAAAPVALAFDRFDGHGQIAPGAVSPSPSGQTHAPHVREIVHLDAVVRPLIDIPSVVETIARLASPPARRSIE